MDSAESAMILARRHFLAGAGLAAGGLLLAGCHAREGGAPAGKLRYSVTGKGDADVRLLLKTAGIAPEGFAIDYSEFSSGQQVLEAMNGGSLDIGSTSEIPPIFAAATQSFRQIGIIHGDVNDQVVLVPKGSPIRDLAGLKGKRIGYVRATTSQYFLIRMLQSVGLGWNDVNPVAMGVSDGAAAFSNGALDAWAIYGFPIERALATEGARILKTALGFLSGNYILVAHKEALDDPVTVDRIGRFIRVQKRGYAWAVANEERWAHVVAREIGVPLAYVRDSFERKSAPYTLRPVTPEAIASQQQVADIFAAQKLIPGTVDVRPLWDDRFNSIIEERV